MQCLLGLFATLLLLEDVSQCTDQTIAGFDSLIQFEQDLHALLLPVRPVVAALEQRVAYMSQQLHLLTAAMSVPRLPCPSLLERNVNRSLCTYSHLCLGACPYFGGRAPTLRHDPFGPSPQSHSGAPCRHGSGTYRQSGRIAPRIGPSLGRYPTTSFKKAANSTE